MAGEDGREERQRGPLEAVSFSRLEMVNNSFFFKISLQNEKM